MAQELSFEEYALLSDQKAADFRAIVQLNPSLLAVGGAIFAAGIAEDSSLAVALAAMPVLLAVLQMVRGAELQLGLATYLAAFAPSDGASWERDLAVGREEYWRRTDGRLGPVGRVSGWNIWILGGAGISQLLILFPLMSNFEDAGRVAIGGSILNAALIVYLVGTSRRIEKRRQVWVEIWDAHGG